MAAGGLGGLPTADLNMAIPAVAAPVGVVHGAILARYQVLGESAGVLGYPTTDETGTPDGIGRYNHFVNNASIYWTPTTGAVSIHGAIRDHWAVLGWERSTLGYPTSDEHGIPGGRQSNFTNGAISWNAGSGTTTVSLSTAPAPVDPPPVTPPSGAVQYGTVAHPFAASAPQNTPVRTMGTALSRAMTTAAANPELIRELASSPTAAIDAFGLPVYSDVTAATPRIHVTCSEPWGTCDLSRQPVPMPVDAAPNSGSDGEMVIIDPATDLIYTLWGAHHTAAGGWTAYWGTVDSLSSSGTTDIYGSFASSGSGLSALTGLVSISDLASGEIDHALAFSSSYNCSTFVSPATKSDGRGTPPNCLPEGARVQLDPSIDLAAIPGITPLELMVGTALQKYGAVDKDTGGASFAVAFEHPTATNNPYPALGAPWDYWNMPHVPWTSLRIVAG